MTTKDITGSGWILPLPGFIFNPITSIIISAVHIYLAAGHLYQLFSGEITWTNIWKGFGALAGAYVFAAFAGRHLAKRNKVKESFV